MLIYTYADYCAIAPLLASFRLQKRSAIASYIAALYRSAISLIILRNVVHVLVEVDDVTMSKEIISINQSFYCALVPKGTLHSTPRHVAQCNTAQIIG